MITVVHKGSIVDTDSTKTTTSYNAEFIEGLPIIGHNYQNILTLAPGVTDGDGTSNVHGARETGLQYRIDGGNVADPSSGKFGQNLNLDIIEETEVITSGSAAEYGRADGGFANIVTRSGGAAARAEGPIESVPIVLTRSDQRLRELSLRVLAELADARELSRASGLPALAGLLAVQYADGGFTAEPQTQAMAAWALAEVAARYPELPWVSYAARRASEFLVRLMLPDAWIFADQCSRDGATHCWMTLSGAELAACALGGNCGDLGAGGTQHRSALQLQLSGSYPVPGLDVLLNRVVIGIVSGALCGDQDERMPPIPHAGL
jgi:hypothetical protein